MNILDRAQHAKYEGAGGWRDGRLGAAYDLIAAALFADKDGSYANHPLLKQLEALDEGRAA